MFENLSQKLSDALRKLSGQGRLSEDNMGEALKEVRQALLGADVHFKVVREFVERVKTAAVGQEVLKGVQPGQMIIKIIHDELEKLLGEGTPELSSSRPLKIMMVGLHGSGKTTSTVKLARHLSKKLGLKPFLVAADIYRPAAIDQLETLAKAEGFAVYADRTSRDVPAIGARGLAEAAKVGADVIIFDTAGRLQIDHDLVEEVKRLRERVQPDEVLLVADSALGQEAVNVSKTFHEAVRLTGIVMTKLDGDARGGAALSMKAITGVPIKFVGLGEKPADFDTFYPDRMAGRILGMGDVVSLVEKAQENLDEAEAMKLAEKLRKADFNFDDMLAQFSQIEKLGSLGDLVKMMPGMGQFNIGDEEMRKMRRTKAMILSMTKAERANPGLLQSGSRRLRIANGSGVMVRDVNGLMKQFAQMQQTLKLLKGAKGRQMMKELEKMQAANPGALPGGLKLPPGAAAAGGSRPGFPPPTSSGRGTAAGRPSKW